MINWPYDIPDIAAPMQLNDCNTRIYDLYISRVPSIIMQIIYGYTYWNIRMLRHLQYKDEYTYCAFAPKKLNAWSELRGELYPRMM